MNMICIAVNEIDVDIFLFGIFTNMGKQLIANRIIQEWVSLFCLPYEMDVTLDVGHKWVVLNLGLMTNSNLRIFYE